MSSRSVVSNGMDWKYSTLSDEVKTSKDGNLIYRGPVMKNCQVSGFQFGDRNLSAVLHHRRGTVAISGGDEKLRLEMKAYHQGSIPDGTYTLVGSSCRKHWVLGHIKSPASEDGMVCFRKVSILTLRRPESLPNESSLQVLPRERSLILI